VGPGGWVGGLGAALRGWAAAAPPCTRGARPRPHAPPARTLARSSHLPTSPPRAGASQLEAPAGDVESKGSGGQAGGGGGAPSRGASRAFYIGILLFFFQQFSGINALVYFSTSVFRCGRAVGGGAAAAVRRWRAGPGQARPAASPVVRQACPSPGAPQPLATHPPLPQRPTPTPRRQAGISSNTLASAAVGATNVLGTIIATSIIEKAGRKQLLRASYAGMGAAMLVMAAGFGLPALQGLSGAIAVLGTLAYILSFAIGGSRGAGGLGAGGAGVCWGPGAWRCGLAVAAVCRLRS
jgi:hypothetical protein